MNAESNQIVKASQESGITPYPTTTQLTMSLEDAKKQHTLIREFCKGILRDGVDYGEIGNTGKKTLKKSGAENLCMFLRLRPEFVPLKTITDFNASPPLFYFQYECRLYHIQTGNLVGSGIGSCNSRETKYHFRTAKRVCPVCQSETIKLSKWAEKDPERGWYCYEAIGGCKSTFHWEDPAIVSQKMGKVVNDQTADLANTLDKMSQKRSLVAATLIVSGLSGEFTQDMEDFLEGERKKKTTKPETKETKKETVPPKHENKPTNYETKSPNGETPRSTDFQLIPLRLKFRDLLVKVKDFFPNKDQDTLVSHVFKIKTTLADLDRRSQSQLRDAIDRWETFLKGSESLAQSPEEPPNIQADPEFSAPIPVHKEEESDSNEDQI